MKLKIIFTLFVMLSVLNALAGGVITLTGTVDSIDYEKVIIRKGGYLYTIPKSEISKPDLQRIKKTETAISIKVPINSFEIEKDPHYVPKKARSEKSTASASQ